MRRPPLVLLLLLTILIAGGACGAGSGRGAGRAHAIGRADPAADCAEPPDGEGATMVIQDGHADQVRDLALSADGRVLASVGDDGTVRVWDTRAGVLVRRLKAAKEVGARSHVVLSDAGDVLAYPAPGPAIGVLDLATGKEIGRLPWNHGAYELSPDGRLLAVTDTDGVHIHDTATGAVRRQIPLVSGPEAMAFDRTGARLAVAGFNGVAIFDVASGAQRASFPAPKGFIDAVRWSGELVAVHISDGGVHLFGATTAQIDGQFCDVAAANGRVYSVGKIVMMNQVRQGLRRWDGKTGRAEPLPLDSGPADQVAVSADGSTIALVYNEVLRGQAIRILDGPTLRTVRTLEGGANGVEGLAFSPAGDELDTRSHTGVRRWNANTGELRSSRPPGPFMGTHFSMEFDPRGKQVVLSSGLAAMQVLDTDGRVIRQWMPGAPTHFVELAALAPGGTELYTGTRSGAVQAWNLTDVPAAPAKPPAPMAELARPPERAVAKLPWAIYDGALSPDARTLVVGSYDSWRLAAVDVKSGAVRWETDAKTASPRWLQITPDGRVLVSARSPSGPGGALFVYALSTGALEKTLPLATTGPLAIRGDVVAVGGEHPVLLDAKSLAVTREITVPDLVVTAIAAHPKRPQFALGGDSGATTLVSAESGEALAILVATSTGEYVTATPEGPYRASVDGARAVAWSFTGPLEGFAFDQFAARFARPDLVQRRMAGEKAASLGPVARPPRVCVDRATEPETSAGETSLDARVAGAREVAKVRVFVNGRLAGEKPVGAKVAKVALPIPLGTGKNRISIIAYDADGYASNPALVDAPSSAKRAKPDLWVVSLGVSRYPNLAASQQLDFADDDARAVAQAWSAQRGQSFGEVHATTLTDAEVTVDSAEKAVGALAAMKPDDLAVIFLAGHGVRLDDGQMVFLTSEASATRAGAQAHGLGWKKLGALLAKARGRVLVLLDACHSGHVSLNDVAPNDALAAALAAGDRGGVFVFAASRGAQLSYEVSSSRGAGRGLELAWDGKPPAPPRAVRTGHGLFTGALLEALSGDAPDRDRSGGIELSELVDYVTERVRGASNGRQTPWVARREMFGDYVVAPPGGKK